MTVVQPNSIAGINSITVQTGNSLSIHKSDGSLIRTITGSTGVTTFATLSVGTGYTDFAQGGGLNIGLGASISNGSGNVLTFGTGGDDRATIDASGNISVGSAATVYANGNLTAGIGTFSAIDLQTGPFNVGTAATIAANGNATYSGIVTAASFVGSGANLTGITVPGGATGLDLNDSVKVRLGTGNDSEIYFDGTNTILDHTSGSGTLYLRGDALRLQTTQATPEDYIICSEGGFVKLCYNNVSEFETKSGGVKLNGHSEQAVNALGNTTGSTTIDFTTANIITATLTGNTTFANPTTESVGQSGSIIVTQDGTGSRTLAWGSQFKWVGGTAPTLTTTAAAVDRIDYLVVAADTIHCVASLDVK